MPRQGRRGAVEGIFGLVLKLEGVQLTCKAPGGRRWIAICPAHGGATPTLIVAEAYHGCPFLRCTKGCEAEAVLAKLGLAFTAFYPAARPRAHTSAITLLDHGEECYLIEYLEEQAQRPQVAAMGGVAIGPVSEVRH